MRIKGPCGGKPKGKYPDKVWRKEFRSNVTEDEAQPLGRISKQRVRESTGRKKQSSAEKRHARIVVRREEQHCPRQSQSGHEPRKDNGCLTEDGCSEPGYVSSNSEDYLETGHAQAEVRPVRQVCFVASRDCGPRV